MKKYMLICAPVTSRSGYGDHARDLVTSFIQHDKYDIEIVDVRWGDCPRNALDINNDIHREILNRVVPTNHQLSKQPDVYVDIRIPNEFQQIGKVNIGITAGIETTLVSAKWLEGCNKMDLIIVPSEHSKEGFVHAVYDKLQNLPNGQQQKVGEFKLEKPIEVLFEGADEDIYKPIDKPSLDLVDDIEEDFCFLFLGQWTKGGYGEDRKDIAKLIKVFYESFANKKEQPALLLKTNGATFSILDNEDIKKKIENVRNKFPKDFKLPKIYLLHGDLSTEEVNKLYNHPKIKAMVSFTHGEGFGRPLLEASMTGLPIMTSGWSGHVDFLNPEDTLLLGGDLVDVPKSQLWKDIIIEGSKWFTVNENAAYNGFQHLYNEHKLCKQNANKLMKHNRKTFTLNKMTEKLDEIVTPYLDKIPQQVSLKLPKLKKAKPTAPKLPKLKKVEKQAVEAK